ncbi:hypothetical protein N7466_004112 [Penicillium verhagenii]|uniref:uncharacterized protein n=1 Tax=Penicillium verhagenii TaxID=1562060 RepID=UPI002545661F|nr:uncharacterized protein N7466_004112 [Penicillium verhagenii]KAJ5934565.1 hypothetical protein N7466_004112 [Penicillium verhagenii]
MLRFWKRQGWFRLHGTDLVGDFGGDDRDRILPRATVIVEKELSFSQADVGLRSQEWLATEDQGRFMSFGIGGAGNIRRLMLGFNSLGFAFEMDTTSNADEPPPLTSDCQVIPTALLFRPLVYDDTNI